jgi:hypothetical protein
MEAHMRALRLTGAYSRAALWSRLSVITVLMFFASQLSGQSNVVEVVKTEDGMHLEVDGKPFMVNGMNWDYFPQGTNYAYSLWAQPDDFIKAALDREMPMLKMMGVNAIRVYTGVTPRWVTYIYEKYGIYTILNHSFGRYGLTIDGAWVANTEYGDPATKELLLSEVRAMVEEFKDVPGVLMWLLGNENNYGLFWGGAETEDIPIGETLQTVRARHMYKLFNEACVEIKSFNSQKPVAICNGDLLFLEIIAEEVKDMDIFGTNMYRGLSFGDAFQRVKDELDAPILFTEFGADAFNAVTLQEDQIAQARYLISNWEEIYANASGLGLSGNSVGGMTFQFSDGWWKTGQEVNLSFHDIDASWSNGGYSEDYVEGENNMNEEWFGVCAKGPTDIQGHYQLYPRAGYYALLEAHKLNPYATDIDKQAVAAHFAQITPGAADIKARGDKAMFLAEQGSMVRLSNLRLELETYNTGGDKLSTPPSTDPQTDLPAYTGFDHQQSFYADLEIKPAASVTGNLSLNILGNVGLNRIDEIFYENRGRRQTIIIDDKPEDLQGIERVKVYGASVNWEDPWFSLDAFYRVGHGHWGDEGDFFGIYHEAYYGENIDIYNGIAPNGMVFTGKKDMDVLKIAFGPELWWGANPSYIIKYRRGIGGIDFTGVFQDEFAQQSGSVTSIAIPRPATKRLALAAETAIGPFDVTVGGLYSGYTFVGDEFQLAEEVDGRTIAKTDKIKETDALGAKVKVTFSHGIWNWYGQYTYAGIVAAGGPEETKNFTDWNLKDTGLGNGNVIASGVTMTLGDFQLGPNFLWQKPLVGPIPGDVEAPGRPRNFIDDPFAVRANREMVAGEFMLSFDPTPATWMWQWDNDIQEDALAAWSLGFIYRHMPTTMDAAIGVLPDGRTFFAFPGATPARDLWEVKARVVSKFGPRQRLVTTMYGGPAEPNGDDTRVIERFGLDARVTSGSLAFATFVRINDWGPYDYHRDFNQTFPTQIMGDLSYSLGIPRWFGLPQTRFGIRGLWRSLNKYSNRYCPGTTIENGEVVCDPDIPGQDYGSEWEIRSYLHINLGM